MLEMIYASATKRLLSPYDLGQILEASRRNNAQLGVSGILLYESGSFLQVLEGDDDVVRSLFAKIARDARHDRISVVRERKIETREFGQWTMGFVSLDAQLRRDMPHSHSLRNNGSLIDSSSSLTEMLDGFRDGRWHNYILG